MTNPEIQVLQELIKTKNLVWNPDTDTSRVIKYIGAAPDPEEGDIREPRLVGYLEGGGYIALWNADAREIRTLADIEYEGKNTPFSKQTRKEIDAHVTIRVPRNVGGQKMNITVCGLCGNTGVLRLPDRHTPYGYLIPASSHFCFCPNGIEFAQREKDLGFMPTTNIEATVKREAAEHEAQLAELDEMEIPRYYTELIETLKNNPSEEAQKEAAKLETEINKLKEEYRELSRKNRQSYRGQAD